MKLKRFLPYLIAVAMLAIASVIYFKASGTKVPVVSSVLDIGDKKEEPKASTDVQFKNYGQAPEFAGIDKWFNTDKPVPTIAGLKGKVVLVNFWTYSCINCIHPLPYITKWQDTYKDQGLAVVGIHTPEFAFEKVSGNVENAIKSHNITFPVGLDNNYKTWTAYKNQFWPAQYLIDKDGNIVYTHFGEGNYDETEKAIRTLLGLEGNYTTPPVAESNQAVSPTMYFGLARKDNFGNTEKPSSSDQIYALPKKLAADKFAVEGHWQMNQEAAVHTYGFGRIKLNFNSAKVFIVAQSEKPTTIRVFVDGELVKGVVVSKNDLYQLYDSLAGGAHTMEIEVPDGGFQAFTFTFG